ncbi:hypothetical protein AVO44_05845 [Ruegeria profundi]|uniref:Uncharacterized protein n=1 Tax=Ruegeria profundi TaxID=1685378 RepID=A0A0X3U757_9RHOB|nr:hypothetical protein AVO44_05845 [Ruegeria profundi]
MPLSANVIPALFVGEMNSCDEKEAPDLFKRVQLHSAEFSFVRLTVQPDDYRGTSIPAWSIGRVLKSYDSSV